MSRPALAQHAQREETSQLPQRWQSYRSAGHVVQTGIGATTHSAKGQAGATALAVVQECRAQCADRQWCSNTLREGTSRRHAVGIHTRVPGADNLSQQSSVTRQARCHFVGSHTRVPGELRQPALAQQSSMKRQARRHSVGDSAPQKMRMHSMQYINTAATQGT